MDSLPNGLTKKYSIERQLGVGASGTVYLVRHRRTQRIEAMKVFRRDESAPNAAYLFARERFRLEAQLSAKIRHPNVLQVYDCDELEGILYITMEYAAGSSLADALRVGGPMPVAAAVRLVHEVALGLQALHDADVIHRDVKPSNLLLLEDGRLMVADLGLAQVRGGQMSGRVDLGSMAAMHPGTPDYMSPEHGRPQSLLPTSDVFSLGCTAFELLTGRVWVREQARVDRVRLLRRDVPPWLDDVVFRMLLEAPGRRASDAADPTKRYVRMADVVAALDAGAAAPEAVRRMPEAPPITTAPATAFEPVRRVPKPRRIGAEVRPPPMLQPQTAAQPAHRSVMRTVGGTVAALALVVVLALAILVVTAGLSRQSVTPAASATLRPTSTQLPFIAEVPTAEPWPTAAPTALSPTDDLYASTQTPLPTEMSELRPTDTPMDTPDPTRTLVPTDVPAPQPTPLPPTDVPTDVPALRVVPTEQPPDAPASDVVCTGSGWFFPRHPNEPLQNVREQDLVYQKAEGAIFINVVNSGVYMLALDGKLYSGDSFEALQAQYGVGALSGEKVFYSRRVGNTVSGNRVTAYVPLPGGTIVSWWYVDMQPAGWKMLKSRYGC